MVCLGWAAHAVGTYIWHPAPRGFSRCQQPATLEQARVWIPRRAETSQIRAATQKKGRLNCCMQGEASPHW